MLFIELYTCKLDESVLLTLHSITLICSLYFIPVNLCEFSSQLCVTSKPLSSISVHLYFLLHIFLPNSVSNHFRLSHAITSPALCPTSPSVSPHPVSKSLCFLLKVTLACRAMKMSERPTPFSAT